MYEVMLVLSVVILAGTTLIYLRQPAASIYHPATIYIAFHALLFVVRPIFGWFYDYRNMYRAMKFTPTDWDKVQVLICTNMALVTFVAVSLLIAREPVRFAPNPLESQQKQALLERFWFVAAPLAVVGTFAIFRLWQVRASGEFLVHVDAYTGAGGLQGESGYFLATASALAVVGALIAYLGNFRWWSLLPLATFAVMRLGSGTRGPVVVAFAMTGLFYFLQHRSKWPRWPWLLALLAVVAVFVAVGQNRGSAVREIFGVSNASVANADATDWQPLETMDLANMEFFEFLVSTIPEKTGSYDYFLHNTEIVTAPIPRSLWPDKPFGAPIKMFELYRYGVPLGITYSVPGVGWYSLGYVGVVIWTAFFAGMFGLAHRYLARSDGRPFVVMAYVAFLGTTIVGFRDGILLSILLQSFAYLGVVGLLYLFARATGYRDSNPVAFSMRASNGPRTSALASSNRTPRALRQAHGSLEAAPSGTRGNSLGAMAQMTPRQRRQARLNDG